MKFALLALGILALPSVAAAQCQADNDCKGDRICVNGECVDPSASAPAPEADQAQPPVSQYQQEEAALEGEETEQKVRRAAAVYTHPLAIAAGLVLGAAIGGTLLQIPVGAEFALLPNAALTAEAALIYAGAGGQSAIGFGVGVGGKWFPAAMALEGFWVGGGLSLSLFAGGVGVELTPQLGYQWVFDNGFFVGAGAGLGILGLASGNFPIALMVPVGFAF